MELVFGAVFDRFLTIVIPILLLGAMAFTLTPSFLILSAAASWLMMRWLGLGSELGHEALRGLDRAVFGLLLAFQGFYAILCSGVAPSGFVTTAVLNVFFVYAHRRNGVALGTFGRLLLAATWALVLLRWSHPVWPWWGCHLVNNVG